MRPKPVEEPVPTPRRAGRSVEAIRPRTGAFLEAVDLCKTYFTTAAPVPVLKGVDLSVRRGEFVAIQGASGSGKSTLLHCLGILDEPTAGAVFHRGKSLTALTSRERDRFRNRLFGFVFQFYHLLPELNALENVLLPEMISRGPLEWMRTAAERRRRAADLLAEVGLAERLHHRPRELSGGEQQRVAIAVALANTPRLLLADEPTGELDSVTALTIYQMFQKLNRELGLTTLIVSHDPSIARHVDRVVAIRDGKLATETVRARSAEGANGESVENGTGEVEEIFEELTVLDSAGRLQIPKEFLNQFGIKGRARLELTEEGILILPATNTEHVHDTEALVTELVEAKKSRGLRGLVNRWMRGEHKKKEVEQ